MDFNFAEYYKRLSNTELFDMLDNAAAYQPSAIDAANNELNQRQPVWKQAGEKLHKRL